MRFQRCRLTASGNLPEDQHQFKTLIHSTDIYYISAEYFLSNASSVVDGRKMKVVKADEVPALTKLAASRGALCRGHLNRRFSNGNPSPVL